MAPLAWLWAPVSFKGIGAPAWFGLAYAEHAAAQQAAAPEESIQRVEVTGSSIKRSAAETAGALQVMTREDIERTGETTALGILTNSSAVSTSLNAASSGASTFANGSSGVGMRGLGKVATLILVNGPRIAQYALADGAQQNFTNIDAIPAADFAALEILAQDDVDHAGDGVGTVDGRGAILEDFDALDGGGGNGVDVGEVLLGAVGQAVFGDALAVDQDQGRNFA